MSKPRKAAVIVGSLRKESFSRKLPKALAATAPTSLPFEFAAFGGVQHFNQDLEATPTAEWTAFRDQVRAADGVLFVTPEYNRGIPGVLKNAIDVGSPPHRSS